ncbi:hypothetical protein Hte_006741 [Hypoxylon texense]
MAAAKVGHLERTATEPRDKFLPGQWLDVYVPGVSKAGGYTITSPPSKARPSSSSASDGAGYVELAVQKSPDPPAAWLWQDPDAITYAELQVRVGGSFVWPPPGVNIRGPPLRRAVFVAGGVGINPLASMLSSLAEGGGGSGGEGKKPAVPFEVRVLYSLKDDSNSSHSSNNDDDSNGGSGRQADRLLFVSRIARIFQEGRLAGGLQLFLTGGEGADGAVPLPEGGEAVPFRARRMTVDDVAAAVGDAAERRFAVVYVCGVPTMTDEFVQKLTDPQQGLGMEPHRVLCEKWW